MSSTTDTITLCANCGKGEESTDDLKACTACKLVKYCNRDCQIAHRPQHKKACKKRAAELYDEALLFKEPPPREECPLCMLLLPLDRGQSNYQLCCGKTICNGCIHATITEEIRRGKKKEELGMCAFCRTPPHSSNEEGIERLAKLMDNGNAGAFDVQAAHYANGTCGIPQDIAKANKLRLKAGELGCVDAYYSLGISYYAGNGVEMDKEKAKHYWELAAMNGNVRSRYNLGAMEAAAGNSHRAMKHMIIAAKGGDNKSLDWVKKGFMKGLVTKDEYASTLRTYQKITDEMKCDRREASEAREGKGSYVDATIS